MSYLITVLIIAAIGYAAYRLRASFRSTQLPGPTGPDSPDGTKPTRNDKR